MKYDYRRIALIPAYNPDKKMTEVLHDLKRSGYGVVIVNDGSDSAYRSLFEQVWMADKVLHHRSNLGKGCAIKTGLRFIRDNFAPPYCVVTADADGQHRIADILRVTQQAEAHRDSLIIGSRRLRGKAPFRSLSGNFFTRTVLRTLTPVKVYDTQSGLRAFSDTLVPALCEIGGERYEYEMKVLIELTDLGIPLRETPIDAVYIGDNSSSHFQTYHDAKRIYREIFRRARKKRSTRP